MELLFMAHRAPFPPNRGDRLRSYHLLNALRRLGPVDLVTQADTEADAQVARQGLAPLCRQVAVFPRRRMRAAAGMALALTTGGSLTEAWHSDGRVVQAIDEMCARHSYDLAYSFSSGTGPWLRRAVARRRIMDLCDLDALKWSALGRDGAGPKDLVRRLEGRRLLPLELKLAQDFDLCLVSTEREARDVRARCSPGRLEVLTQGASWQALADLPPPSRVGPVLGFLGQMDYPPNERAVEFLARQVLPGVRARVPEARLVIFGRAPSASVRALAELPGVQVVGEVASVADALASVAIFCAPIDRGRGIPTKVVEAMAAGRAVVASGWAAGALMGVAGQDYLVADGAEPTAAAVLSLLDNPAAADSLAAAGQRYVRAQHDWQRLEDKLVSLAEDLLRA